jgi:hypothetical protein
MPGHWPPTTITRLHKESQRQRKRLASTFRYPPTSTGTETDAESLAANLAAYDTAGTTIVMTLPSELADLLHHVDFSTCGHVLDPWSGTGSIAAALRLQGVPLVISNDLNPQAPAEHHLNALYPSSYDVWASQADQAGSRVGAIVTSPHWAYLDLALPLAVEHAEEVACVHVPPNYIHDAPPRRREYLKNLMRNNRLCMLQCRHPGAVGKHCLWLIIFKDRDTGERLARTDALRGNILGEGEATAVMATA